MSENDGDEKTWKLFLATCEQQVVMSENLGRTCRDRNVNPGFLQDITHLNQTLASAITAGSRMKNTGQGEAEFANAIAVATQVAAHTSQHVTTWVNETRMKIQAMADANKT